MLKSPPDVIVVLGSFYQQMFAEDNPPLRIKHSLKLKDFRDAYPRFPPIRVCLEPGYLLWFLFFLDNKAARNIRVYYMASSASGQDEANSVF